eukprot:gnl/MRDRNA2_/MRDRNA2_86289_c0_seq1.p1 gnl/MRDRNA2_/MRDRNA2_86289_c0~~gnl/MRDRNA2_/MRDRNA2_86289_c0_seq1.p1  ORF type:complete len:690 (+),score=67.50 gnl/MRDRNA2_/MRDRNA2_86289_c0_seq1:69-2138(+)
MGKFGCRLYCWGCGGCCLITGVIMGVLASLIPPGMLASIQEATFDLAYIDDTSQSEAEGLLADAGLPISESDAFKAWGKSLSEGLSDCLKADFPFDWSKTPEDCVEGLHPTYTVYNATNLDTTWGSATPLEVTELGYLAVMHDTQKVEPDTAYWDETGKARFRIDDKYTTSKKCDGTCHDFSPTNGIMFLNFWYGVFAMAGLADGWSVAHAMAASPPTGTTQTTLQSYLTATEALPMDPHSSGLPVDTKTFLRLYHFTLFLFTPDSPKLGDIDLKPNEYSSLHSYLLSEGKKFHETSAAALGVPKRVSPFFLKTNADAILGWGEVPYFLDPISSAVFTFDFVGGASKNHVLFGTVPSAFVEEQMSSAFYHEGLGYVTQHYENFFGPVTYNHSCGFDPDCGAPCFPTDVCVPLPATGYDGFKIPGTYFGSPKGAPGMPAFTNFVAKFYLAISMTNVGRTVIPAKYKGPDAEGYESWSYNGLFATTTFKAAGWTRRLENCNYPDGRMVGGVKDSPGIDCNWVMDTSPLMPYFGLPLYWHPPLGVVPVGWDSATTNGDGGPNQAPMAAHVTKMSCIGNAFCSDVQAGSGAPGYSTLLSYGYEPNLGAMVDVSLYIGLGWKLTVTGLLHPDLAGQKYLPFFWLWNYLHLPAAINMELSKLQGVPAALNGFYIFLITQCMVSLIGGVTCCFCGV